MRFLILTATVAVASASMPVSTAQAAHVVVFDAVSSASANEFSGNSAFIVNGVQQNLTVTPGGAASTASLSPSGFVNEARVTSATLGNAAFSFSSLEDGTLRGFSSAGGVAFSGTAFSNSYFGDTLFFTNMSGSAQLLSFVFTIDGNITGFINANDAGGFGLFQLSTCGACSNVAGQYISHGNPNLSVGDAVSLAFNGNGINSITNFGSPINPADFTVGTTFSNGDIAGFARTTLLIPTGLTSLGLSARLSLDCRVTAQCDFGHTGRLALGTLPTGLTFTSASGVFLTGLAPGAIPEPSTWAAFVFGFGAVGVALRRRKWRPANA